MEMWALPIHTVHCHCLWDTKIVYRFSRHGNNMFDAYCMPNSMAHTFFYLFVFFRCNADMEVEAKSELPDRVPTPAQFGINLVAIFNVQSTTEPVRLHMKSLSYNVNCITNLLASRHLNFAMPVVQGSACRKSKKNYIEHLQSNTYTQTHSACIYSNIYTHSYTQKMSLKSSEMLCEQNVITHQE